jgi:hypothetical protein
MFLYAIQMKFQFIVYGFIARILNWLGSAAASKNVNYKEKVGGMGFVRIRP